MFQICPANLSLELILEKEPKVVCPYNFTITVFDDILNTTLTGASVDVQFSHVKEDGTTSTVTVGQGLITDENGQVVVPMNANGDYSITVTHDGYTDTTGSKTVECEAQSKECNIPCNPSKNEVIRPKIRRPSFFFTPWIFSKIELFYNCFSLLKYFKN